MTDVLAAPRPTRDPESTRRLLAKLRRRSLLIHFWRGALPALIGVGLAALLGWAGYKTFTELSVSGRQGGAIRMVNPEFHGRNKTGQPYVVTAEAAVKDAEHPERMALTEPRLVMETVNRGVVHGASRSGLYDENAHILNLWGGVTMTDGLGYHFQSPTARVDTETDRVEGHDGSETYGPMGRAVGDSYFIDDKAGHTVLTGHVLTHLIPKSAQPAASTPTAPPATPQPTPQSKP